MELIQNLKQSLTKVLGKNKSTAAIQSPPERTGKAIRHGGFRNVFSLYTEEFAGLTAYMTMTKGRVYG